jgi:hypothetical protein
MSVQALATQIVQICISFARLSCTGSAALRAARHPVIKALSTVCSRLVPNLFQQSKVFAGPAGKQWWGSST